MTPPTRHMVSSEGVIHFFFFYKLITFKLVHSYNVKHLTCTIFYSSGLQNIYKLHIWKCSIFIIFTLFTNNKKIYCIYKIDQKVFRWASNYVLTLETDEGCPTFLPLLPYLHGCKPMLSFILSGNKLVDDH